VTANVTGRLDLGGRQECEERESRLLGKLAPDGVGLADGRRRSRLSHGDLLVVVDWWGFVLKTTKLPLKEVAINFK
jgi:hypothetical protein